MKVHKDSRKYTAFMFDGKSYQSKVLPFVLNVSVSVFIRAFDGALGRELLNQLVIYVDNILLISDTWKEHCILPEKTLAKFWEKGITIK